MNNTTQRCADPLNPSGLDSTPNPTSSAVGDPIIESCALTAAQAARLLGISESHLYDLMKEGRFGPEPKRMGRARRFDRAEVLAWFRAGCPTRARWQALQQRGGR
jgi:excisionase family DNA binding protein